MPQHTAWHLGAWGPDKALSDTFRNCEQASPPQCKFWQWEMEDWKKLNRQSSPLFVFPGLSCDVISHCKPFRKVLARLHQLFVPCLRQYTEDNIKANSLWPTRWRFFGTTSHVHWVKVIQHEKIQIQPYGCFFFQFDTDYIKGSQCGQNIIKFILRCHSFSLSFTFFGGLLDWQIEWEFLCLPPLSNNYSVIFSFEF